MPDWLPYLILALTGFVSGTLNVVAGGGSFFTLPILIFLGLPATVANGTNRIGVLMQNAGGVWGFSRHRVLDWKWALEVSVPALAGAALGTWAALHVSDVAFRRILAGVMVLMSLWPILGSRREPDPHPRPSSSAPVMAGFFLIGIYGGFLQAGVGFLILALTSMVGLDLVRGNAIKAFSMLLVTILSIAIFASAGAIDWPLGLALGAGNLSGSFVGVRLTVLKGHTWVRTVVTIAIIGFAIRLWFF